MTTRWSIPAASPMETAWTKRCPGCAAPLSVRLQLPLWLTMLVGPDDERLLLVDECEACGHARARITRGDDAPDPPPTQIEAFVGPERGPPSWCGRGHRVRTAVRLLDRREPSPTETPVRICLECEHASLDVASRAKAS